MPRKSVKEERKLQILKALDDCLQTNPFHEISIKDIAAKAGVKPSILHYYFQNKEDILLHFIDYFIAIYNEEFFDKLEKNLTSKEKISEKQIIQLICDKIIGNRSSTRIFLQIWSISDYNPVIRKKTKRAYTEWIKKTNEILAELTDTKSRSFIALIDGLSVQSLLFDEKKSTMEHILNDIQSLILPPRKDIQ